MLIEEKLPDETSSALYQELVRKLERLERAQRELARDMLYVREAVRLRLIGTDVYEDSPLLTQTCRLDIESDFNGLNWYALEGGSRWSGPGLLSTIFLPLERDADLDCRVLVGAFAPTVPRQLYAFVDGKGVAIGDEQSGCFEFVIPAATKLRAHTEIGLLTKSVTQPSAVEAGNSDSRWIGFQLRGLEVFPSRAPE